MTGTLKTMCKERHFEKGLAISQKTKYRSTLGPMIPPQRADPKDMKHLSAKLLKKGQSYLYSG